MNYTFVGLFASQEQSAHISEGLEKNGFFNSDYIVYITDHQERKHPLWQRFFTNSHETGSIHTDSLIVSVAIRNERDLELAQEVFAENGVLHTYALEDVHFSNAKDLEYLKKVIGLKAKMHIYEMPEVKVSHFELHSGMNTEIKNDFTY